jgi:hypothetical protein
MRADWAKLVFDTIAEHARNFAKCDTNEIARCMLLPQSLSLEPPRILVNQACVDPLVPACRHARLAIAVEEDVARLLAGEAKVENWCAWVDDMVSRHLGVWQRAR